ncbi:MAG: invasion associated locus B family protein [Alphaproteobacteria bacterium]
MAATTMLVMSISKPANAGTSLSAGEVRGTFGAWQMRCGRPPGASKEKCALVQSVKAQDRQNVSLMVIFMHSYDGKSRILRVFAPLGVLLPPGLGLKIDNADVGHAPFMKCGPVGCMAEVMVKDDLFKKMQTGKNAVFIIFQTPEAGIGIPISLGGFAQGLAKLN